MCGVYDYVEYMSVRSIRVCEVYKCIAYLGHRMKRISTEDAA